MFLPRVRPYLAEFLGTATLVAAILGPGFMAQALGAGDGLGLLIAAVAAGAVLFVIITVFQSISGAHFNPAVTLVMLLRREVRPLVALGYFGAQISGALVGALIANVVSDSSPLSLSQVERSGAPLLLAEFIATLGLVLVIVLLVDSARSALIPAAVALWIVAGHLFLSSTSFANPAVTFGRMLSDAPNGIDPGSVPAFVLAQLGGALVAVVLGALLSDRAKPTA
jgi:glycerol uptake facilitator-like aquaporin